MAQWVMRQIYVSGYAGIALLMFVENVFPPIPSELIMPLAGFITTQKEISLLGVIFAGTFGSALGALALYYVGLVIGEERLKRWIDQHGRWFTISCADIDQAKRWFDRYGHWAVLACRLVPGVRSLISIPAGLARMKLAPFVVFTTFGTALWTSLLAFLGYALGANYANVEEYFDPISYVILGGLVALYVLRVIRHKKERA